MARIQRVKNARSDSDNQRQLRRSGSQRTTRAPGKAPFTACHLFTWANVYTSDQPRAADHRATTPSDKPFKVAQIANTRAVTTA